MSILVTPSLFGSVDFYSSTSGYWHEKAAKDLDGMLNRNQEWNPSFHVDRGIRFEKALEFECSKPQPRGTKLFNEIVQRCHNGVWQKKTKKIIEHEGEEYCLYGKIDVWFFNEIIDVKTTDVGKTYDDYRAKYLTSMQHHMYCFTEGIDKFTYIVALFKKDTQELHSVIELQHESTIQEEEKHIRKKLDQLLNFFSMEPELNKAWREKYSLY